MFEQLEEPEEKKPADYSGAIIGLSLLPVVFLSIYFGKEDAGRSVAITLAATLLAIRIRWDLKKQVWFWVTIVIVVLLHLPLWLSFRWPSGWIPASAMLPVGLADCLIALGAVRGVEKLIPNQQRQL